MALKSKVCSSETKSSAQWLTLFFSGMCMGAADLVPGISGGTVAFVLGFYQELIASIQSVNTRSLSHLFRGHFEVFFSMISWRFLLTVIGGALFSIVSFAHAIHYFLGHEIYRTYLYSLFFGLILASIYICAKQIKVWKLKLVISLSLGMVAAYALSGASLQESGHANTYSVPLAKSYKSEHAIVNYDPEAHVLTGVTPSSLSVMLAKGEVSQSTVIEDVFGKQYLVSDVAEVVQGFKIDYWIVICGSIAICALLLPGISGSYLLTLLGVYGTVLAALIDFIHGIQQLRVDMEALSVLSSLTIGIIFGAIAFSKAIHWLLSSYRETTLAGLIGFIAGAMPTIWPFWTYHYMLNPIHLDKGVQLALTAPYFPSIQSFVFFQSLIFAVFGFFLVILLEWIASINNFRYKTS